MSAEPVFQSFEQERSQYFSPARLELTVVPPLPDDDINLNLFGGTTQIPLEHVEEWRLVQKELQEATLLRDTAERTHQAAILARIALLQKSDATLVDAEFAEAAEAVSAANARLNAAIVARLGLAGVIRDKLAR